MIVHPLDDRPTPRVAISHVPGAAFADLSGARGKLAAQFVNLDCGGSKTIRSARFPQTGHTIPSSITPRS